LHQAAPHIEGTESNQPILYRDLKSTNIMFTFFTDNTLGSLCIIDFSHAAVANTIGLIPTLRAVGTSP
jgi:hypothetical protein